MKLNKNYTGTLKLGSSHSMVLGHLPDKISHQQFCKKMAEERKSLMKFGFFDSSAPNYTTYYNDVTAEDLVPKEGEFIYPVFRALSETIVSKYVPIDFSRGGVLKASMSKLIGQSINVDHEVIIGNAIGSVKDAFWQESYETNDEGIVVPAGINIVMMIDGKSNPRIARGIMMNPPSIHSNSVGIRFKWEPSHEFDEKDDFFNKVGSYDKDGELIRAVVTEIMAYNETSLVPHGADVFAQKIGDDGKIINPEYSQSVYQFSGESFSFDGTVHIDYKDLDTVENMSFNKTIPHKLNTSDNKDKKKVKDKNNANMKFDKAALKTLTEKFGFKEDELTEDNAIKKIADKFSDMDSQITQLQTEVDEKKDLVDLGVTQEEFNTIKANATIGETHLTETRKEAARLYKLAKQDKADDNIIETINKSELKLASSFLKQYEEEVEEKFQPTCTNCGEPVSLSAGVGDQENLVDENGNPIDNSAGNKGKSSGNLNDTVNKFRNRRKKSLIFRKKEGNES